MLAAVAPFKIALIFLGAGCTSIGFGVKVLWHGWRGFRDASYPLSSTQELSGFWARMVAGIIMLFGAIVFFVGVATIVFGYFRVRQLI